MMHRTICRLLHGVHHRVGTTKRSCISQKYKKNANAPPSCIRSRRCENGATLNRYKSNDTSTPIVDAALVKETVIPPTVRQLAMHALRSAVPMIGKYVLLFYCISIINKTIL